MYNSVYAPFPYRHHGMVGYPPYDMFHPLPAPDVMPPYQYDYPYRRGFPRVDYPCYDYMPPVLPRPPLVHTNVHNDVSYYLDDPYNVYDDEYGSPYRLSQSKVQLVDLPPKTRTRRNNNQMVVSTFQPRDREERVIIPRSNIVRHAPEPPYERRTRMKLVPLYHSAQPHYAPPHRGRSVPREIIPVATVANSHSNRQTIRKGEVGNSNPLSPLFNAIDVSQASLLEHSMRRFCNKVNKRRSTQEMKRPCIRHLITPFNEWSNDRHDIGISNGRANTKKLFKPECSSIHEIELPREK